MMPYVCSYRPTQFLAVINLDDKKNEASQVKKETTQPNTQESHNPPQVVSSAETAPSQPDTPSKSKKTNFGQNTRWR